MRRIAVRIYSGTTPFELPEAGTVATLWANKPDGTRVYKLAEAVNDAFVVTLTSQMCAAVGLVNCELQVVGPDGETLTTPRFDIAVEDAMTDGDQVESTDEMTALTEALARVASIEESEAARAEAETKREEAEAERVKAESEREEALAAAVDAAENAVEDVAAEAKAEVAAAVETADKAAQRANAAAKAAEDIALDAVGWDTIPDKPETFPPSAHTHAIADVTGLSGELDGKAPLESPVFTGAPEAPTAAAETSGTQIATTGFVHDAISHDITGKRASGAAVTVSGVIPNTALTEFTVYGRSTQDAVPSPDISAPTGNNLFRGIGVADDEPGYWYKVSNTSSTSDGFARFYSNNANGTGIAYCDRYSNIAAAKAIEPGKEYKILLELRNVGVVSSDVAFYLDGQYVDGNQYGIFGTINIPVAQIIENARMIYEVKAREDFSDVDLALRTQCHVPAGSACDFEARISIYPADYDVTEYEPYQGGPVEIVSAEVESAISCGANLFRGIGVADDESGYYGNKTNTTAASDGFARFAVDNSNGTSLAFANRFVNASTNTAILPNTKYKILAEFRNVVSAAHLRVYGDIQIFPTIDYTKSDVAAGKPILREVQTKSDFEGCSLLLRLYAQVEAGVPCDFEARISIYPADYDVTEYEPYQGTAVPVNLTLRGIPVDTGGNYTDADGQEWICDTYDAVSGEYVQRVAQRILDGNETVNAYNWESDLPVQQFNIQNPESATIRSASLCTHLPINMNAGAVGNSKEGQYVTTGGLNGLGQFIFAMPKSALIEHGFDNTDKTTVTNTAPMAMKSYLTAQYTAGTPVIVDYAFAEPVTTYLPPQYIRAYSPVTNASAGGAEIGIEYNNIAGSAYKPPEPVFATLAAANWSGEAVPYTQTVTAAGVVVKPGSTVEIAGSATDEQFTAALDAKLRRAAYSGANVTIKAYGEKPTLDIPILL